MFLDHLAGEMFIPRLFHQIKGAILYTRAGADLDRRDYKRAIENITHAERLLRLEMDSPRLFYFDLRYAKILIGVDRQFEALARIDRAVIKITENKQLSNADRLYLLDFCQALRFSTSGRGDLHNPMLPTRRYSEVTPRYLREYPLERVSADSNNGRRPGDMA